MISDKEHDTFMNEAMSTIGVGVACGTCGELVQGCINNQNFMITFPIPLTACAKAEFIRGGEILILPNYKHKAAKAAEMLLHSLKDLGIVDKELGVSVTIETQLIEGKGMASSTADIVAVCRAISHLCNYPIGPWEISNICTSIEPSDGVMYQSVVVYDFFKGCLLEDIGPLMPMRLLIIDNGEVVDTVSFKRIAYTADEMKKILGAYDLATRGIKKQDIELLGRAATISAHVNQRRHYKKELNDIIAILPELGAYGVSIAHSGSIFALLFAADEDMIQIEGAKNRISKMFPEATIKVIDI
ncbi:kinase [Bacillus thuringiensis]|uniref:GHMP family kinase ATP-binding protein n=1 Tax=Bacillus thuringiensis TaxID=1428 RepID=UPI000E555ACC|nr:kinase [Bacillus thuringiensis]MDZ3952349.1 kinase [Bacillus thuringiensis]RGP45184.1 kinase [Bacillus thuringiensis]